MRKVLWLVLALTLVVNGLFAKSEKFRLMSYADPATSMMVGWCQVGKGKQTLVLKNKRGKVLYRVAPKETWQYLEMTHSFVTLSKLSPNTAYQFHITDSDGDSEVIRFKTLKANPDNIVFVCGGDSRNHHKARRKANIAVSKIRPHFVAFAGDMTSSATPKQWTQWLDDWQLLKDDKGYMPFIVPARGNHERPEDIHKIFNTPHAEDYFAVDIGSGLIRLYTLNSNIPVNGDQLNWLKSDLEKHSPRYRIVQYHHPVRPHQSKKRERTDEQFHWSPIFYQYQFALGIECDAHTVKRTWPIRPDNSADSTEGFVRDDRYGTVFIGEGCWGAPLRGNDDTKEWTRSSGKFNQIGWVKVTKEKITIRTVNVDQSKPSRSNRAIGTHDLPKGIVLWEPSEGKEVVIYPKDKQTPPSLDPSAKNMKAIKLSGKKKKNKSSASKAGNLPKGAIVINLGSSGDDVEELLNPKYKGKIYDGSSDLEMSFDGDKQQIVGLYFANAGLSPQLKIKNAYVQFTADEDDEDDAKIVVSAELSIAAKAFDSQAKGLSGRRKSTTTVSWQPAPWKEGDATQKQATPSLKALLQELVGQKGWTKSSPVVLLISGDKGTRCADSFEGGNAAYLVVIPE